MIAAALVFIACLLFTAFFLRWGMRVNGRAKTVYRSVEGALAAAGLISSAVIFFTFGRSGGAADDPEYFEWLREAFALYAGVSGAAVAAVVLFAGLIILVRLAEKEKAGRYGGMLIIASPFIGSTVVFAAALFAIKLSEQIASPLKFEIAAFAVSLSFVLHAVLLAASCLPEGVKKK